MLIASLSCPEQVNENEGEGEWRAFKRGLSRVP